MRIAVVGIGGVGGYFGGKLAKAYAASGEHEVLFIARGAHLTAIAQNGLQLLTREGDYVATPSLVTDHPDSAGHFDLVLFCVKSYALESAATAVKGNIDHHTVVIPLQNGINSAQRLKAVLSDADVIDGSVYIISHIEKPGVIRQTDGACRISFGTDHSECLTKYRHILGLLTHAGIDAVLTDRMSQVLWTKYLLMCPLGSLTSATAKTYGEILTDDQTREKLKALMTEVFDVARAKGVALPDDAVAKTLALVGKFAYDSKTSMQKDHEKGGPTEIDALTAYVRQEGRQYGVPTPVHDDVYDRLTLRIPPY